MAFIKSSDGTQLFYQDWGSGKPIVLVHGWATGSDMWEYQVPHLVDQEFRCILYDQRGCGRSDYPSRGHDFDTHADDLAAVLDGLDVSNVALVGFSLGGGVIARYLARHGGGRVSQTVLVACNMPFLLKSEDNPEGLDRSAIYEPFLAGLRTDRPQLLAASAPAFFFGMSAADVTVSSQMIDWAVGLCLRSSAMGMLEMYEAVNKTDFRPDMSAFTMPTLVVHGDADPFQPIEATARRTARAIAGSRLEVYEGASHGIVFTHRDRLNADLTGFCKAAT